jgi:hypothetical protein
MVSSALDMASMASSIDQPLYAANETATSSGFRIR